MMHPETARLAGALADATERALREAEIRLPPDVLAALRKAAEAERNEVARQELANILENIALAEERQVPICQDTGVPVVYLTLPPDIPLSPDLYQGVREGVRRATATVPLRPNVVDPLSRENTNDNTGAGMPAIHVAPGDRFTVTVLPKGAGSENVSRIGMLLPSQVAEIKRFVAETVLLAGGRPCPPVILGVGIGGTFDLAAALAKEALLLPIDVMDDYEQELCDAVNALGIGPMGLGGDTTALAVKVKRADCHTASLPVAVNVQCWACRRATVEVER
ncbi:MULTISPECIES: fumarate hydratase [Methanoculleus]|jgi:fumarate hydratase subunit alpha|uniref:Fumarase, class I alpha subunit n=1 Tax=Methanoculleus thermophilus TaxID=2200 RepID=A0A1G8Y0T5_9EURY|nr:MULTISPECIES: fumarate hydratase [Methanoculleus]NLN09269.1 fumarate hydratase [Methanoculleus thermophilus]SDJ95735.1 fumarase, class I alpha subunit [Methanoculleus thermophilus]HQD24992.1 fumarate hydratase [Methanoculleus thermophilus]